MVARQVDVLIFHHPEDGPVAERLRAELASGAAVVESSGFDGDLASLLPDEESVRAIVVVVSAAVERGVRSALDSLARRRSGYLLVAPGPEQSNVADFPKDRTFEVERTGELVQRILRDLAPDQSQSYSNAPPSPGASASTRPSVSKTAAPRSDEESGPSETLAADIFGSLDRPSRTVFAEADRLARLSGASRIHMDHLFVALYREPDGATQRFFAAENVTTEEFGRLVKGIVEPIVIDPPPSVDELEGPPAISRHVGLAVKAGRDIASSVRTEKGGDLRIATRHLLYGALSVDRCSLVKSLRRGGRLDKDRIDLVGGGIPAQNVNQAPPVDIAAQVTQSQSVDSATQADVPISLEAAIAGFASDDAKGPDLLDIRREVDALGKVIAARDVAPPLAIGLFGDWGTGKTFFMKRLQRRIRAIAAAEAGRTTGQQVYCREIVQLEFNAWTYIDDNLWASLAAAIFDGLDASLTRRDKDPDALRKDPDTLRTDEFERAKILTDRAAAQHDLEAAQQAKAEADRHLEATEARLANLATGSASPAEIVAGAWTVAMSDEATKTTADQATESISRVASELHLDPEVVTRELRRGGDYRSRIGVAIRSLLTGWRWWLPVAILAAVIIGVVAVVAPVVAPWLVGISGLAAVGAVGYVAKPVWKILGTARSQYLEILERDRRALKDERTAALERAAKAQGEIDAARTQLLQAESNLEGLRPSRQLANFVSGRHASADYRGRLGVVAQAREDFEQLTQLIANGGRNGQAANDAFPPAVDRIILYIDDLDRCREKEVVDVLQAVHLLLAFPLFVVVVAVDPRWLVHSLRVQSRVLQGQGAVPGSDGGVTEEDEAAEWQSTPLNYLEKIFQVPYAIRPMGETGFKAMIDDLVGPRDDGTRITQPEMVEHGQNGSGPTASAPGVDDPTAAVGEATTPATDLASAARDTAAATPSPDEPGEPTETPPEPEDEDDDQLPVEMQPGFLHISDDERTFMGWLHPLVRTPRAAKRFVNVYRILKASVEPDRRAKLDQRAEHRAVLTLLAMLSSHPTETTTLLQSLVDDKPTSDWWSFFKTVRTKARIEEREAVVASGRPDPGPDDEVDDGWSGLSEKLGKVQTLWPDAAAPPFCSWAREVSRFSFESSRVLLTPAPDMPATNDLAPAEDAAQVLA